MIVFRILADASSTSPEPNWSWLTSGGAIGVLAGAVVAFLRGWIVPASEYRRVLQERDRALSYMEKQAEMAQRILEAAERKGG